jgi:hypothetical protein
MSRLGGYELSEKQALINPQDLSFLKYFLPDHKPARKAIRRNILPFLKLLENKVGSFICT